MPDPTYYLERFSKLLPRLLALPDVGEAPRITHGWHQEGLTGQFWEEGDHPKRAKPGIAREKSPKFRLQTKTYSLEGSLQSEFGDPYWVFDLRIFHANPLHSRTGRRGPYSLTAIEDILEEDLDKIAGFLDTFSPKSPSQPPQKKTPTHEPI